MKFKEYKEQILARPDKSAKGGIDKKIKPLCDLINAKEDFVTLSSCSGRIALTTLTNKLESRWVFVTHEKANPEELITALKEYKEKFAVEFKQESAILHIAVSSIEKANEFIQKAARQCGFGRFGITSVKDNHCVVELVCAKHISAPVFDKEILVSDEYITYLVEQGNDKLTINWTAIDLLEAYFNSI